MTDLFIFNCPKCGKPISTDSTTCGHEGECPTCRQTIIVPIQSIPSTIPPVRPPPLPANAFVKLTMRPKEASGIINAGWMCFAVGICLMIFMLVIPVYGLLFLTSITLGVIAIVKKRVGPGLALILCSVLIPPVVAVVVAATFIGTVISGLTGPVTLSQAQEITRSRGAVSNVNQPPTQAKQIHLAAFLAELDRNASAINLAQTTAQKEEARKLLQQLAVSLLANGRMTISTVVVDVRIPREGSAEITYRKPDFSKDIPNGFQNIQLFFSGHVTLAITRDQALRITTGTPIQISGRPVLTITGNPLSAVFALSSSFATISLKTGLSTIGNLNLDDLKCKIGNQ